MDVLSDAVLAMRAGRPYATLTDVEPPWTMAFSAFPGARLHVVTHGTCDVVLTGAPSVTLAPGDAVVLPHGAAHRLRSTTGGHLQLLCGAYQLDRARAHPLVQELPDSFSLPARAGRGGVERAVALLREELTEQAPGREIALPALLDVLLVQLIRSWSAGRVQPPWTDSWAAAGDPVITLALRAIHASPEAPWTVESLGAHAGLSRSAFARRFTELIGLPPLTYLTWWRLTTATRLLRTTDAPLSAVAERTGYGSPYAFANAFKRQYGLTAGQYRQRQQADRDHVTEWTPPVDGTAPARTSASA